jgi:hypothetical protein
MGFAVQEYHVELVNRSFGESALVGQQFGVEVGEPLASSFHLLTQEASPSCEQAELHSIVAAVARA